MKELEHNQRMWSAIWQEIAKKGQWDQQLKTIYQIVGGEGRVRI